MNSKNSNPKFTGERHIFHYTFLFDAYVYQALGEYEETDSLTDLLYDATYEALTSICELLDGYTNSNLHLDIINKRDNSSLKAGMQMHDVCANYLKWKSEKEDG